MKKVNSLKFWHELLFMLMMVSFTACVDDNEDTEAPYLEVNPATLTFENGGVQTLEISTNRQWKATVEDADWISLSKIQGEGSDQIQVSVPEGTIGEAKNQHHHEQSLRYLEKCDRQCESRYRNRIQAYLQ